MQSDIPKPIFPVAGRAMVLRVIDSLDQINLGMTVIIIGHQADLVKTKILADNRNSNRITFAIQKRPQGTGDAVAVGLSVIAKLRAITDVIILNGDVPLVQSETIVHLVNRHTSTLAKATLMTAHLQNPSGYGRIIRQDNGSVREIIEEPDANHQQKKIREINGGIYCFCLKPLKSAIFKLRTINSLPELRLTDVVGLFSRQDYDVGSLTTTSSVEVLGVNDYGQLAAAEQAISNGIVV